MTAPGCGVGLSIVHEVAQHLGGDVVYGPGLNGQGVTFEVTLSHT